MKIGIVSPIDITTFISYFESNVDKENIQKLADYSRAPAVNTLSLSLLKAGNYLKIFTLGTDNAYFQAENIEIYVIKKHNKYPTKYLWGIFIDAKNIKNIIQEHIDGLDVLHAHWSYEYAYAIKKIQTTIPKFCTVRDWYPYIFRYESGKMKIIWLFKSLMAYFVYKSKDINFIANSPYTANLLKHNLNIDSEMLPNSVKDSFFDNNTKNNNKEFRIVCISSSHDDRKNIVCLLKAFNILSKKYPEAILDIIGSPFTNDNPQLKNFFDEGLIGKNVNLLGKKNHDELHFYLDRATLFVSPSLEETFGNTFLEAIARKVPVIGGVNSGAVPFVLHHGDAGYLCDVSSPLEISKTIEYVYTNLDEANEKAIKALDIIRSEYSESVVCKKHIDLFSRFKLK